MRWVRRDWRGDETTHDRAGYQRSHPCHREGGRRGRGHAGATAYRRGLTPIPLAWRCCRSAAPSASGPCRAVTGRCPGRRFRLGWSGGRAARGGARAHWDRRLSSRLAVGAARCHVGGVWMAGMPPTAPRLFTAAESRTGGIEPPAREAGWKAGAPSPGRLSVRARRMGRAKRNPCYRWHLPGIRAMI